MLVIYGAGLRNVTEPKTRLQKLNAIYNGSEILCELSVLPET
jgi:hypothetical protein